MAVATDALVPPPDSGSAVTAATLPLAGLTAIRLLRAAGPLFGRRVLLAGASGGVGHFVVELAAAQGARVTAVSATPERVERLLALGATGGRPPGRGCRRSLRRRARVRRRSQAGGSTGSPRRGVLFWFGQAGRRAAEVDFFAMPARATVRRFAYWPHDEPDHVDLATLVALVAQDRLHPEVGLVADWHETPDVLLAVRDRRVRGNAVLTVDGGRCRNGMDTRSPAA